MRTLSICVLAVLAAACTVKEDRNWCPALCVVYSDGYVAEGCPGELTCSISSESHGKLDSGTGSISSFSEKGNMVFEVPRNENVFVDVFCGVSTMTLTESALRIPMGFCCDGIYSGHGSLMITGEVGEAGLPIHKDYARLTLVLDAGQDDGDPLYLRILGNVDGYTLPGGRPHRGEFDYRPPEIGSGVFRALIPRQSDDSLTLEICRRDDGSRVALHYLGKSILDLGYDWERPDLMDLDVTISMNELSFGIEIVPWEENDDNNITL